MESESMLYDHGKGKSRKFAISLLKVLDKRFPKWTISHNVLLRWGFQGHTLEDLKANGLIDQRKIPLIGLPEDFEPKHTISYRITPLGVAFLNGLEQKKTNKYLLGLTILLSVFGLISIILQILK